MRDTDKKRENQNVRDTDKKRERERETERERERERDRRRETERGRESATVYSVIAGKEREGKGIGWERWSISTEDCQQSAQMRNKFL